MVVISCRVKLVDCPFGRRPIGCQMARVHMCTPKLVAVPILIEREVGGIVSVLMEIVPDTAHFRACPGDQLEELRFDQIGLTSFGLDMGDDCKRHDVVIHPIDC